MLASRLLPAWLALTLLTLAGTASASGPLTSAVTAAGSVSGPSFTESWTFTGTTGDRVLIVAVTTSGLLNTTTTVYAPGGALVYSSTSDRADIQLTFTGTYTVEISDQGLNDAGSYSILWTNLTAGPLTHAGDLDGGPIGSGDVVAATVGVVTDVDAYTFSGVAGERVLVGVLEGTAFPFNVALTLYPPGGGAAVVSTAGGNRIDYQLLATGTYTVVVEDVGDDHTGSYTVSYLNVTSGPHSTLADTDGGAIPSATAVTGTMDGVVDFDAFTVTGNAGDRIAVVALTTSGAMNTSVSLYPPNGAAAQVSSSGDRWDFQLTQSGTHTLVMEDQSFGETGTYKVFFVNLTSGPLTHGGDLDGGPIGSGEVIAGSIGETTDLDVFTFPGTLGDRVLVGVLEGTSSPFNVPLTLYPPGGGPPVVSTGGNNKIDYQLAASGTYVVVVEDIGDDHTGNYTISYLNVTSGPHTTLSDPDGSPIPSATFVNGTMNGVVDFDAYTITGNAGDRIAMVALTTSGPMNTSTALYPPNGGAPIFSSAADRWDVQLTQSGTWTLVVEDQSFGETGTYRLSYLDLTSGPLTEAGDLDGGPIASGEVRAGTIGTVGDLDAFTFSGTSGERVLVGVLEGTAPPFNVPLTLYPPGGGPPVVSTGGNNKIDYQLLATGTFVVVVEDIGNNDLGSYTISYLNVTSGPHSTLDDPDGSALSSDERVTGTMNGVVDFDAFTFSGTAGDRVLVAAITTSGTMNTTTTLYPPGGGSPTVSSSGDRWDFQLTQTGTWTIVMEDQSFGETGTYALTAVNLTSGPYTFGGDVDGGTLPSNEVHVGAIGTAPDIDAFTFNGTTGDRVVIGAVVHGGAPINTVISLYPPGGGPIVVSSGGSDRVDYQLAATGTYTVAIEDLGDDQSGAYGVDFVNVTAGPVTSLGDLEGGWMVAGDVRIGSVSPLPDFDVYWFYGVPGDTAKVSCVTTSGALNTYTYLYPPGGGNPVISTSTDTWNYALQSPGQHAILVQHTDLTQQGTYQLNLNGPLTPVDVPAGRPAPARLELSAAYPNPSSWLSTLSLALPARTEVTVELYDLRGARVRTLADRALDPGVHRLAWDGRNDRGDRLPSGVYLARVQAGAHSLTRRIVRVE